ncbi:GNAT family N-acetyltransferase [Kangiella sp. TOML190]|uniref:GNAT family N-acetyltransferase n=1 Tax=Kangiella sp. TOML190 TaxID=2931351 RepID=UPI00204213BC|nr:GNAT family N-acetyltransferase [Kangiella sp. TOML190]
MQSLLQIIDFSDEYKEQVIELIVSIQQKEFDIPIGAEEQPDLEKVQTFYQQRNGNFWLALINKQVVGTVALLDIGNNQAALRKMFVHAEFRGPNYGIAKALLARLLNWSEEKEINEIYLGTTSKFLAAHRFYEKNNFQETSKSELPKSFPVMQVDTKFYKCTI